ncbi:MFS transporter [Janibacter sp. GXQ6167]|uniref:MFS transporter n=1 Tax=Janibacter sp. GXQ6167 TaxID=3240791 RepID=UPI00352437B3
MPSPTTTSVPQTQGIFGPAYRVITIALIALVTIVAFEMMSISTAMPLAAAELDMLRSYGLAFSVMYTTQLLGNVLAGVWTDRSGPMPSVFAGQILFAAGCATCALANSSELFLVGRALTGLGAGLLVVALYVVVGRFYPEVLRPKVFAAVSAAWVLPALIGPVIAGWLSQTVSWRWVFAIVVPPVVLTGFVIYARRSVVSGADSEVGESSRDHDEHVRAAWFGLGLAVAAGILQWGARELDPEINPRTIAAITGLVAVLLTAPFLIPKGTFRMARGLPSVILARMLLPGAYFGSLTYVPLMLEQVRGTGVTTAGLVLAVGALGWALGAWAQGQDAAARRRDRLVTFGGAAMAAALAGMATFATFGWPIWTLLPPMVVGGIAMGAAFSSVSVLALDRTPVEDHGSTATALTIGDMLGSILGVAGVTAGYALLTGGGEHVSGSTFGWLWGGLAVVAAVVIPTGLRIGAPAR